MYRSQLITELQGWEIKNITFCSDISDGLLLGVEVIFCSLFTGLFPNELIQLLFSTLGAWLKVSNTRKHVPISFNMFCYKVKSEKESRKVGGNRPYRVLITLANPWFNTLPIGPSEAVVTHLSTKSHLLKTENLKE